MRRSHWEDDLFSVCCKWLVVQQSLSLVFRSQPSLRRVIQSQTMGVCQRPHPPLSVTPATPV